MKGCKTKHKGVLGTLEVGPASIYGQDDHERECIKEAERMLLEAKEPLKYRTELLRALLDFTRQVCNNDHDMN